VRVTIGAAHQLVGGASPLDTIADAYREAVASYAASVLCKQIATRYGHDRDASVNADSSNQDSRARNFAARARDYRAAYYVGIGKADPQSAAGQGAGADASGAVTSWPGRTRGSLTRMEW